MQENTILGLFHSEAGQLYDVCSSLRKVCMELHHPETRLDVIQIQLFAPFRPMLASRLGPDKVSPFSSTSIFFVLEYLILHHICILQPTLFVT